jgi:hypothetical protein
MGARSDPPEVDDWLRHWTAPEEDRAKHASEPRRGETRWFRAAPKVVVVCLENYRRPKASVACARPPRAQIFE